MQRSSIFLAALIAIIVLGADRPVAAQGLELPPAIFVFQKYDENLATLTVSQTIVRNVPVTLTRVNAAGVEETETMLVPEYAEFQNTHLLAETTMRTIGGKDLDRKEAAKVIKKGQPIILLVKGQKLAERYKGLFRDDVLVFEVKALGTPPELDPVAEPRKK